MSGRPWTKREDQFVREHYSLANLATLSGILGRTTRSIWQRGRSLGQRKVIRPNFSKAFLERFIQQRHAAGWTDAELGRLLLIARHRVGKIRRGLGLASNRNGDRHRDRVRQKTRRQLDQAGLSSLAEVRSQAFRDRAKAAGWPDDLRPRAVQILNALWEKGPRTRRQLAEDIGMPWKGSRKSLVSNDPEGSYLAHLIARGLVISIKRGYQVTGKGRGHSCNLYSLPLYLERGPVQEEQSDAGNQNTKRKRDRYHERKTVKPRPKLRPVDGATPRGRGQGHHEQRHGGDR